MAAETTAGGTLLFAPSYEEVVELPCGTQVALRLLHPDDGPRLLRGLARMSPESRYMRFMVDRTDLSESELRFLCEVDGHDHFAIGAAVGGGDGEPEGVAVARFVRLRDAPHAAEPAIAVIDDYQGRGLGRILLHRLASAALERGVTTFRCEFLPSNRRIRYMLSRIGRMQILREDGLGVTMDLELQPERIVPPRISPPRSAPRARTPWRHR